MLDEFARFGIQVFLTTHRYFPLKRLEQLALRKQNGADVVGTVTRLADGLPDNPIIQHMKNPACGSFCLMVPALARARLRIELVVVIAEFRIKRLSMSRLVKL